MRRSPAPLLAGLFAASLLSCARTDLGAPCHLQDAVGGEVRPRPGREYLYLGSSECASFTCLAMPGETQGYCSQACSGPGASCPSGLACAQIALDQGYVDFMRARLPQARFDSLFGQLSGSYYCVRGSN
jgi:hypothetical protein